MGLGIYYYINLVEHKDIHENSTEEEFEHFEKIGGIRLHTQIEEDVFKMYPFAPGYYTGVFVDYFRAGSYGGYGDFINILAQLAGYEINPLLSDKDNKPYSHSVWMMENKEGPFVELIDFSDCEGVIGSSLSNKLYHDFCAFQDKVDAIPYDFWNKYFKDTYANFKHAFKTASNNGAVVFH